MSDVQIVALGQPAAGDDGVGPAVLERLRADGLPAGVSAEWLGDPSQLVERVTCCRRLVLIDAVVGAGPPGQVLQLDETRLAALPGRLSTHGLDAGTALALARQLHPDVTCEVAIVAIAIDPPRPDGHGLSAPVAEAVERAAALALTLARDGATLES